MIVKSKPLLEQGYLLLRIKTYPESWLGLISDPKKVFIQTKIVFLTFFSPSIFRRRRKCRLWFDKRLTENCLNELCHILSVNVEVHPVGFLGLVNPHNGVWSEQHFWWGQRVGQRVTVSPPLASIIIQLSTIPLTPSMYLASSQKATNYLYSPPEQKILSLLKQRLSKTLRIYQTNQ